jgi:hypothetical protein
VAKTLLATPSEVAERRAEFDSTSRGLKHIFFPLGFESLRVGPAGSSLWRLCMETSPPKEFEPHASKSKGSGRIGREGSDWKAAARF